MRNRCFAIGIVILAVACLSYVGYREFRQHLEFKEFIAKANSLPVAELFPSESGVHSDSSATSRSECRRQFYQSSDARAHYHDCLW